MSPPSAIYVIPCYNEAKRLDSREVGALVEDRRIGAILVNDGSTDATGELITALAESHPGRVEALSLARNSGKAEAVRQGLLTAIERGVPVVGFADADFATPVPELVRLLDELERTDADIVLGSRILRLGATIDRSPVRHVVGRVFATVAAAAVGAGVYDTQCGAKLFKVTPALVGALATPFSSRWSFDVELLCRLFGRLPGGEPVGPEQAPVALEVPLREWREIGGSKLHLGSMAKSFGDLLGIWARAERHTRKRR